MTTDADPLGPAPGASPAAPDAATNTGLPPRIAAALAYAAWWVTGGLFLILEPAHPFVRFHARQAWRGFGVIWILGVACWTLAFASAFLSTSLSRTATILTEVYWAAAIVLWAVCVTKAWRGQRWAIPGLPHPAREE